MSIAVQYDHYFHPMDLLTAAFQGVDEHAWLDAVYSICQVIFFFSALIIFLYNLTQVHLMVCDFRRHRYQFVRSKWDIRRVDPVETSGASRYHKHLPADQFPLVTIQLPVYNELYVVDGLIDNIVNMDWPRERLEIQVLDDSTDETLQRVAKKVQEWKDKGVHIEQLRREKREGYKAGALKEFMSKAKGELIAYFDSDFRPEPDFLKRTVFYFEDPKICLVQTRWTFLNPDFSIMTRLQVLPLNVHFRLEQPGRYNGGFLSQFNGTAGVWRKKAVADSGGWHSDTLVEDVDLSIRAQLQGWQIKYAEHVAVAQEIPPHIAALKIQQHRWHKGTAECGRKILPSVWKSRDLSFLQKMHTTLKCIEGTTFVGVLLTSVLSVPMMVLKKDMGEQSPILGSMMLLIGVMQAATLFYANVIKTCDHPRDHPGNMAQRSLQWIKALAFYLALVQAVSVRNTFSIWEGWTGRRSEFVRTPKFNAPTQNVMTKQRNKYLSKSMDFSSYIEVFLLFYFSFGVAYAVWENTYDFIPQHLLMVLGFGMMVVFTVTHG